MKYIEIDSKDWNSVKNAANKIRTKTKSMLILNFTKKFNQKMFSDSN